MSEFFLGQVFMTGFGFAPAGSALCNGQLLSISQNQGLFSLLGTFYGGNGMTTFALPDLRGRTPVHAGTSADPLWAPDTFVLGEAAGVENVTLTVVDLPAHDHALGGSTLRATSADPTNRTFAVRRSTRGYSPTVAATSTASPFTVSVVGGGQPHTNLQPYTTINFCIALQGIYPSRD